MRVIHWSLLVCVVASWLTQQLPGDWFAWHVRSGYAVLVLVVTRLLWGVVGTRHARFVSFVRGPSAVIAYLRALLRGRPPHFVGHNPLGALMVLALLALLLAQALTGLFSNDDVLNTGPLYGYVTDALSRRLTGWHHRIFDLIEIAVGAHIAAVLFYWLVRKDNLIWPMLTGRKPAQQIAAQQSIRSSRTWLALLLAALLGAVLWYVISTAPSADVMAF